VGLVGFELFLAETGSDPTANAASALSELCWPLAPRSINTSTRPLLMKLVGCRRVYSAADSERKSTAQTGAVPIALPSQGTKA